MKDSSPCCASVGFVVRGHQCLPVAVLMSENSDGDLNLGGPFPSRHFAFGLLWALGGREVLPPRVGKHLTCSWRSTGRDLQDSPVLGEKYEYFLGKVGIYEIMNVGIYEIYVSHIIRPIPFQ